MDGKPSKNNYWKIGLLGMICINICYIPQVLKTAVTHNVSGISLPFFLLLFTGLFLYLIYAIKRRDIIYIISNISSLIQSFLMICMVILFGGN